MDTEPAGGAGGIWIVEGDNVRGWLRSPGLASPALLLILALLLPMLVACGAKSDGGSTSTGTGASAPSGGGAAIPAVDGRGFSGQAKVGNGQAALLFFDAAG
jgi:hypothetical protein